MYYKQMILYLMRTFIEKTLNSYVEYLDTDTSTSKIEIATVKEIFRQFTNWLYMIMKDQIK